MIGKLLGVATVGSTLASVGLLNRFLLGVTNMVILAIVCAFMLCALLAGGFYMAYLCLVHYGLDPYVAGIALGIVALFVTIALITLTISQIRQMRELLPSRQLHRYASGLSDLGHVADAFIEGFLNPKK